MYARAPEDKWPPELAGSLILAPVLKQPYTCPSGEEVIEISTQEVDDWLEEDMNEDMDIGAGLDKRQRDKAAKLRKIRKRKAMEKENDDLSAASAPKKPRGGPQELGGACAPRGALSEVSSILNQNRDERLRRYGNRNSTYRR